MKFTINLKRFCSKCKRKVKHLFNLIKFWKPDFVWLYKNQYLRMDANVEISPEKRRQFCIDRYKFAAEYLRDKHPNRILDAACGTGYGSDILKNAEPKQIIGVDICPKTVAYATKSYGTKRCIFKAVDILTLSGLAKFNVFEAVVSFETIEHIDYPIQFLRHIHTLLKKGGTLILSTPNKWGLTKYHKVDYDYEMLKRHIEEFFVIKDMYVQNSGSMDLWINRGCPRRLIKATTDNIEQAECFIAVCRKEVK